jgi:hypothetical protein
LIDDLPNLKLKRDLIRIRKDGKEKRGTLRRTAV